MSTLRPESERDPESAPGGYLGKRTFDVTASSIGLILLSPLLVFIVIAVRMTSPGPAIFRQERVGLNGGRIKVWKFRTMIHGAEGLSRETLGTRDPRITPLGRRLRRTKLDELPQLVNVLRGSMSMVGPRPEIPFYADRYGAEEAIVLAVKPGITDPSSLEMADLDELMENRGDVPAPEYYTAVIQPRKLALQKDYIQNQSLLGDIRIIIRTIFKVIWT